MLWAVTSYFNPCRYQLRLANYRVFRRELQVPLVTVELSYDGEFQLGPGEADMMIRIHGRDVMWQKERLLNIGIEALPKECDKVAWLDCDVVFENPDWPAAASEALNRHVLIQPFEFAVENGWEHELGGGQATAESMFKAVASGRLTPDVSGITDVAPVGARSGLASAARRELLARHGLYDACIAGSGDRAIIGAILGTPEAVAHYLRMGARRREHYMNWACDFHVAAGGPGYCAGTVRHLWHGDRAKRRYQARHIDFAAFDFDPYEDIALEDTGCWRWNSEKPAMHQFVRDYFASRMEDGPGTEA